MITIHPELYEEIEPEELLLRRNSPNNPNRFSFNYVFKYEYEYDDAISEIDHIQRYTRNVVDGDCIVCYKPRKLYSFFKTCNHTCCFDCFVQFKKYKCVYNCTC